MTDHDVVRTLEAIAESEHGSWNVGLNDYLAQRRLPRDLIGDIPFGDAAWLWMHWFVDSMVDVERYGDSKIHLLEAVVRAVDHEFPEESDAVKDALRKSVARVAYRRRRRRTYRRRRVTPEEKRDLLAGAGQRPRCWICGFPFRLSDIRRFLQAPVESSRRELPDEVDFMAPRGIKKEDAAIEVDHVVPLARGGVDDFSNFRLACGWCNRKKSDGETIYGPDERPTSFMHPRLGRISTPHGFWVVRLMVLAKKCQIDPECTNSSSDSQLYVAAKLEWGAPSPTGLVVCCRTHDPIRSVRFVPRTTVTD